jgi:kynurenine 3-monooxygenase
MVGLEDEVLKNGIPMHARMIHGVDGSRSPILYGRQDQVNTSISSLFLHVSIRGRLKWLLSAEIGF